MALLAAEFGLEESFGALGMALASSKLPTFGTRHALIPARSAARVAAQVALGAGSTIAVISVGTGRSALAILQLQSLLAGSAVHARHTLGTGVQTLGTDAHLHVVALVALVDAALVLQQQRRCAG